LPTQKYNFDMYYICRFETHFQTQLYSTGNQFNELNHLDVTWWIIYKGTLSKCFLTFGARYRTCKGKRMFCQIILPNENIASQMLTCDYFTAHFLILWFHLNVQLIYSDITLLPSSSGRTPENAGFLILRTF
jgi:hypothetical protein